MSLAGDWWENPATFSPQNDPDGMMAERYHQIHGEWPKGSRQRWEVDRAETEERRGPFRFDAHPQLKRYDVPPDDFTSPAFTELLLTNERLAGKVRLGAYTRGSLRIRDISDLVPEVFADAVYALEAHVLKETLPPEHITGRTIAQTVTVHVGPATWWDFWKLTHGHKWWARWWVKRHPARVIDHPLRERHEVAYELTTDERKRLYPHADIRVTDKLGRSYIHVPISMPMSLTWLGQVGREKPWVTVVPKAPPVPAAACCGWLWVWWPSSLSY